ncbi:histidine phosphatase family protein [Aspergillus melleus]|uniref:histidine phosphatase family protein n=1 Tax=Aspergillus melleus TaxID=138277 RepID=UPI001E8DF04F|nr:putative phosphoglycerate mutase pmu1 [Aspergillus melleus]KAH8423448.1 putative phosphoglycerate mutase pmu1 [Aspergillus melleus]
MATFSFSSAPQRRRYRPLLEPGTTESRRPHPVARYCNRFFRITVVIPVLLVVTLLVAGLSMMAEARSDESHLEFFTVPGFFLQDDPETDPDTFDYVSSNFGLISRPYDTDQDFDPEGKKTQWQRLAHHIDVLNENSGPDTSYKLLFLGRHGEGFHNVAEQKYGTELWDCYWSLQDGDENGTWVDSRLTKLGESQAETAHRAWLSQIEAGIPAPQSYYASPLNRCLATASITFKGTGLPLTEPFRPLLKELLRETIGLHTCDSRSSKSAILAEYPLVRFEEGFAEEDPLYDPDLRESDTARDVRFRDLFQDIFAHDENTYLSLTAHSGAITSMLQVVGHRKFALATGGVIPVLVRAERVKGPLPVWEVDDWTGKPECKGDPKDRGLWAQGV